MDDRRPACFPLLSALVRRWWRLELGLIDGDGRVLEGRSCCANRLQTLGTVGDRVRVDDREAGLLIVARLPDGRRLAVCAHGDERPGPAEIARLTELLDAATPPREPLPRRSDRARRYDRIIGHSRPMQELFRLLDKVIDSDATVMIHGESGTGKELVARAIHDGGHRARKPFVAQNCSALNDNLLESSLFGHLRGSFTGATRDQPGLFEAADGGTLFLDEIGDMSPALQVKLLRVLQEGAFSSVGSTELRHVDVRVLTASHRDLRELMEQGRFREDLYYRINVLRIPVPSLWQRIEDLEELAGHFLRARFRPVGDEAPPRLSVAALDAMRRYPWPGNVRELENEIERMLVLGGGMDELPEDLLSPRLLEVAGVSPSPRPPSPKSGTLREATEQLEREMIRDGLLRTQGNRSQLAKELGVSRSSLALKIARYGLDAPSP